ncbi:hypothetical protein R1flu_007331 [Riccia fluitans]|uniref:Uncharacterized protein n=1 Tax=Riccia fluitans TaxID=41844 RepID=A0ABD1YYJ6_9MARC
MKWETGNPLSKSAAYDLLISTFGHEQEAERTEWSIMQSAGVTRLVNADEMFLQFYPKETHLIAPTNTQRVGSNQAEDAKKECTVMVACEMFQSQIIAPMIIMTGQPDGTLSSHFSDQVKEKAADLNITLGGIPHGCTSLIQVCDLIANKPIKLAFKTRYVSWKIASDPGPGGKNKVD